MWLQPAPSVRPAEYLAGVHIHSEGRPHPALQAVDVALEAAEAAGGQSRKHKGAV